jgi:hypothetical protein
MGERDAVYALFDWENELSIHRTMDGAKAAAQRKADEYDEGYTFAWESDADADAVAYTNGIWAIYRYEVQDD